MILFMMQFFTTYTCACQKDCTESKHLPQGSVKHWYEGSMNENAWVFNYQKKTAVQKNGMYLETEHD